MCHKVTLSVVWLQFRCMAPSIQCPGSQYQLLIGIIIATLGGVNKVSSGGYQIHFISCKKLIQNTAKFHILDCFEITNICIVTLLNDRRQYRHCNPPRKRHVETSTDGD